MKTRPVRLPPNHLFWLCNLDATDLLDIPDPRLDVLKRLFVGDVIDQENAHGTTVVANEQIFEKKEKRKG